MKITKVISLLVFTLAIGSQVKAYDYEEYKVEGAVKTERNIASEKEKEREPSSVTKEEKEKEFEQKHEEGVQPTPWRYRSENAKPY